MLNKNQISLICSMIIGYNLVSYLTLHLQKVQGFSENAAVYAASISSNVYAIMVTFGIFFFMFKKNVDKKSWGGFASFLLIFFWFFLGFLYRGI